MKAIPPYQTHPGHPFGVLPEGVYPCDETAFRVRFVEGFPDSTTRPSIHAGFSRLRSDALERHICATQWLDGSFVEQKLDPSDLDVVSFCDYDATNALSEEAQRFVASVLAGGDSTKPEYRTHTFFVPCCRPDHEFFPVYEHYRRYWRDWFGRTRTGFPKGFVAMKLCNMNVAPDVGTSRDPS